MILKRNKSTKKHLSERINLIPMINLIFLLLIFFLLTGVISKKSLNDIKRPISKFGQEKKIKNDVAILEVDNSNIIYFNDKTLSLKELKSKIQNDKIKYIIEIDRNAKISIFNNIVKEFKKKEIQKIFVRVTDEDK